MKKIKLIICVITLSAMCFCLFGCGSDEKNDTSKESSVVKTSESIADKVSSANEIAQKIANQAQIICFEMEMEEKFLKGEYSFFAGEMYGGEYSDEFSEKLQSNLSYAFEFTNKCKIDVYIAQGLVSYATYYDGIERECMGAYPDIVTVDEINNGATYDSIVRDRQKKAES